MEVTIIITFEQYFSEKIEEIKALLAKPVDLWRELNVDEAIGIKKKLWGALDFAHASNMVTDEESLQYTNRILELHQTCDWR